MASLRFGRVELMWAKWTCSFFASQYVAGGWLHCWYVGRLRVGWRLTSPNVAEWNRQPSTTQAQTQAKV
jgi:hypothetical protein